MTIAQAQENIRHVVKRLYKESKLKDAGITLMQFQQRYAKIHGYKNWSELINSLYLIYNYEKIMQEAHIFETINQKIKEQ